MMNFYSNYLFSDPPKNLEKIVNRKYKNSQKAYESTKKLIELLNQIIEL